MNEATQARRRPVGAEMVRGGVVEFRVWDLGRRKVEVVRKRYGATHHFHA